MLGHEAARDAVKEHLAANLPTRLAAVRARLGVSTPVDPEAYLLADTFPLDASQYPIVLVQSTQLTDMRATEAPPLGVWVCEYNVQVVVGARAATAGAWEEASRQRDRLLLAARETLMYGRQLTEVDENGEGGAVVVLTQYGEDVGEAAQDVQSRPLAAGQISLRVRQQELLADPIATVETATVDLDPVTTDPTADITPPAPEEE